jgi:DNA-binding CsgD family transcriptional regulator
MLRRAHLEEITMFQAASALTAVVCPFLEYHGPERRAGAAPTARWLSMMLDEIDHGMLLLTDDAELVHMNRAAHAQLDTGHPLQILNGRLRVRQSQDASRLHDALSNAALRGLRKLVALGDGVDCVNVAVIPLGAKYSLVVLGKRHLSERISVQCFARMHGLTPAETRVLEALCDGLNPKQVAEINDVGLSTVRTQIGSIRAKTGAGHIRALVRQVAVLPPMVGVLRC